MVIELSGADGEHVVVKQRLNGATETQAIDADTTVTIADGDTADRYVGFGVGEKADFRFDDAGTDKAVAASVALRYHYGAHGRVVGRSLDPDETPASQYFVYDNDRIVQELDGSGNLVAEWVYGTYIDEVHTQEVLVPTQSQLEPIARRAREGDHMGPTGPCAQRTNRRRPAAGQDRAMPHRKARRRTLPPSPDSSRGRG